jgi:hypothetical protein
VSPTEADALCWARITARNAGAHPQAEDMEVIAMHVALQTLEKYRGKPYRQHRSIIIGAVKKRIASFLRQPENLYRRETRDGKELLSPSSLETLRDMALANGENWEPPAPDFVPHLMSQIEAERKLRILARNTRERELMRRTMLEGESVAEVARDWGMTRAALQKHREEIVMRARAQWEAMD